MNLDALEYDYGRTAPGNYLIGFMVKYYTDKANPDFDKAQRQAEKTLEVHRFAHIRLDLFNRRAEVRYNFKTGSNKITEVLNYVR